MQMALEVFCDLFEFIDERPLLSRCSAGRALKTVIEMVVDERSLSLGYSRFHGLELLRNIETRAARFDHRDDAVEMTCGAFQSFEDLGVSLVSVRFRHALSYPLPGD